MNKSALFTKAHKIARNTVKFVGNYSIAFSLALKEGYKNMKTKNKTQADITRERQARINKMQPKTREEKMAMLMSGYTPIQVAKTKKVKPTFWGTFDECDESGQLVNI